LRILGFGYLLTTISLLALGLVVTHALEGSLGHWDLEVNRWLVDHRDDTWNTATGAASWALNTVPVIMVAAVAIGALIWRHRLRQALVILFALTLEISVFLSVTFAVARPRPDVLRLNATPATSSFPSGHSAAALVLYGGIALAVSQCSRDRVIRVLVWSLAVATVVSVAFARVYRGMHHPSDVAVGAAFGVACLWCASSAVRAGFAAERPTAQDSTSGSTDVTSEVSPDDAEFDGARSGRHGSDTEVVA
jgi:undecaprenyl-diphosphatase